jgi:Protein of unknown function (DUF3604)
VNVRKLLFAGISLAMTSAVAMSAPASKGIPAAENGSYSPVVRDSGATNLYWGDTHLHTRNSADAFTAHNEGIERDDAFRFAMGLPIRATNGMVVKLRRPLDFLAITDHAEYMGVFARLKAGSDSSLLDWPLGKRWAALLAAKGQSVALGNEFANAIQSSDPALRTPAPIRQTLWDEVWQTADRYNAPGRFSAFSGYEWTSMINGDNLHRIVMFRDDGAKTRFGVPFSAQDSTNPEDLWAALDAYEKQSGGEVLAIAHNGNVSNGRMFAPQTLSGQPLSADYARRRSRWEPVYEMSQVKGTGETHPSLSPSDEFANFEIWDKGNITLTAPKQGWMLRYEYARSGLLEGLRHQGQIGVNPFKFGMIGASDSHTGYSAVAEHDFWGKFPESEPQADRVSAKMAGQLQQSWELGASGLAAVWAPENTREALFAAFKRREVYGTTGSRIMLRFFGSFGFAPGDVDRPNYAQIGYRKGVPMGGDLTRSAQGKAPAFMVVAAKDPDEANLDRIQIVKGWVDAAGNSHEKIFEVALSDGRRVNRRTGKAPPVGSTVNLKDATYTNSIGDPELSVQWTDPDFDPHLRAFYYVRVLEIPKPRWTAYDAVFFRKVMAAGIPMTVQDRAYSSPIWYNP